MNFKKTFIDGLFIINNFNSFDNRGIFVKTFHKKLFKENTIDFEIAESYYSVSKKNVIRGMHFQLPPNDHMKLVYVPYGEIIDVVIDLRKKSETYGKTLSLKLSSENKRAIMITKGFAHGFKSMIDNTITMYNVSSTYDKNSDNGILYDSIDFDWDIKRPILSERDVSFETFNSFKSKNPF